MILNQQVNSSEVTAEHLNYVTPGKIGMAGRKYKVRTNTGKILPIEFLDSHQYYRIIITFKPVTKNKIV
jgi:hypothetical protein